MEQKFQVSLVCDQQISSYWSSLVANPQILKSKSNWKSISDNTESQNFVQNKYV